MAEIDSYIFKNIFKVYDRERNLNLDQNQTSLNIHFLYSFKERTYDLQAYNHVLIIDFAILLLEKDLFAFI